MVLFLLLTNLKGESEILSYYPVFRAADSNINDLLFPYTRMKAFTMFGAIQDPFMPDYSKHHISTRCRILTTFMQST